MKRPKLPPTPSDYEYTDLVVPLTVGLGLTWKDEHGHECETRCCDSPINGKRVAILHESSWVGTAAIGAMHYYAHVLVHGPVIYDKTERKTFFCGGYGPQQPKVHLSSLRLEAKRRLTKPEKDMAGDILCKVGDYTNRFTSPEEAKAAAITMFKRKFAPGWVLVHSDETTIPIAHT